MHFGKRVNQESDKEIKKEARESSKKFFFAKNKSYVFIAVVLSIFVLYLANPFMTALATYSGEEEIQVDKIDQLTKELLETKTSLRENKEFREDLFEENKALNEQLNKLIEELTLVKNNYELLKQDFARIEVEHAAELLVIEQEGLVQDNSELIALETQVNATKQEFENFVDKMAVSVCCKEKVDNILIDSFSFENNEIVCLQGGEKWLECPFW